MRDLRYDGIIGLTGKGTTDNAPCGSSGGKLGLGERISKLLYTTTVMLSYKLHEFR